MPTTVEYALGVLRIYYDPLEQDLTLLRPLGKKEIKKLKLRMKVTGIVYHDRVLNHENVFFPKRFNELY